jgi:hypothetical protein
MGRIDHSDCFVTLAFEPRVIVPGGDSQQSIKALYQQSDRDHIANDFALFTVLIFGQ